jgi:hypothetical protein
LTQGNNTSTQENKTSLTQENHTSITQESKTSTEGAHTSNQSNDLECKDSKDLKKNQLTSKNVKSIYGM